MDTSDRTGRRRRRTAIILGVVGAIAAVTIVSIAAAGIYSMSVPPPEFASLHDRPDPSLRGTVAFYRDGCVRVIAASGAAERKVLCLGDEAGNGPQLAWRNDGRLEVTTFDWPTGGELGPGSQRIVDVASGAVEVVPAAQLPREPDRTEVPAVGPAGERVTATREVSGWPLQRSRLTVMLEASNQRRTLMSGSGNPDYGVALGGEPVWSPNGDWVVMSDDRLLLITTGDRPETRVLVADPSGIGSWGSAGIRTFAATDQDLFADTGR